jgi:putative transposase
VFVKFNGETRSLFRALDHEGDVLERHVTKYCFRRAAMKLLEKTMKRDGRKPTLITDKLRFWGAAMTVIGNVDKPETGRWLDR